MPRDGKDKGTSTHEEKLRALEARLDALTSQGNARDKSLIKLKLQIQQESLLSKIAEANVLLGKADYHIKALRDDVYEEFAQEIKVILEAFQAKNNLAKDIFKDFLQTIASLQSGPITISPTYHRTEEGIKKALKKAKKVSTKRYDQASPLIASPFGTIEQERARLSAVLTDLADTSSEEEIERTFESLFAETFEELDKVYLFCDKLRSGQSREVIRQYYLQSYAATCFKAHLEDRQSASKKGVIIQLARFIFATLEIDYPLKRKKLNMLIKKPLEVQKLLDAVNDKESKLAGELDAAINALSKRPLSARPDTSHKGRCDRRRGGDPRFLGMVPKPVPTSSATASGPALPPVPAGALYEDDFEEGAEGEEVETDIEYLSPDSEEEDIEEVLEEEGEDKTLPFRRSSSSSKIGTFYTSLVRKDGSRLVSRDPASRDPLARRRRRTLAEKAGREEEDTEQDTPYKPPTGHGK